MRSQRISQQEMDLQRAIVKRVRWRTRGLLRVRTEAAVLGLPCGGGEDEGGNGEEAQGASKAVDNLCSKQV